jgi:hypothetical protein
MGGTCSTHGDMRNAYINFAGNPEVTSPVVTVRRIS